MSTHPYDTRPNPGDEDYEDEVIVRKPTPGILRCKSTTKNNRRCKKRAYSDDLCHIHFPSQVVTKCIKVYPLPFDFISLLTLKPCPTCNDNVTYGEDCNSCLKLKVAVVASYDKVLDVV
jgi:hypothetical protein